MASRSRTTFKKRQKELARLEKQREKAARRKQRKLEKQSPETDSPESEDAVSAAKEPDTLQEPAGEEAPPSF